MDNLFFNGQILKCSGQFIVEFLYLKYCKITRERKESVYLTN